MRFDDDQWPELSAGDPRLADIVHDDPSVKVYSESSPLKLLAAEYEHQVESDRAAEMLGLCILLLLIVAVSIAGWLL